MKKMKYVTLIIALAFIIGACGSNPSTTKAMDRDDTMMKSEATAYNLNLNDINGGTHTLGEYKGKKVYIKYWASWCSICLGGMDEFNELVKSKEGSKDVVVLSMVAPGAFGEKKSGEFIQWYKERGYSFPVLLDEGGTLGREFGVRAFPTSIYLNSDGVLTSASPGHSSNESIEAKLAAIK